MTRQTGCMGDSEPDETARALPVTSMLLSGGRGEAQPGAVLEQALARSHAAEAREAREAREAAAAAPDADERAAGLVVRGLAPGMVSGLAQQLADAEAEVETERAKIAKGERVNERVRGMLERGQVAAWRRRGCWTATSATQIRRPGWSRAWSACAGA
jgi:hypothetical protein